MPSYRWSKGAGRPLVDRCHATHPYGYPSVRVCVTLRDFRFQPFRARGQGRGGPVSGLCLREFSSCRSYFPHVLIVSVCLPRLMSRSDFAMSVRGDGRRGPPIAGPLPKEEVTQVPTKEMRTR